MSSDFENEWNKKKRLFKIIFAVFIIVIFLFWICVAFVCNKIVDHRHEIAKELGSISKSVKEGAK